jgi:hypothetical protein
LSTATEYGPLTIFTTELAGATAEAGVEHPRLPAITAASGAATRLRATRERADTVAGMNSPDTI